MNNLKKIFLSFTIITICVLEQNCQAEDSPIADNNIQTSNQSNNQIGVSGFADIVEKLLPAVVNISTNQQLLPESKVNLDELFENLPQTPPFDSIKNLMEKQQKSRISSLGSGFIISADGYIVTNYHVISDAEEIVVNLGSDNKFKAKLIGSDKKTDLALLKIEAENDLPFVKFSSSDQNRIGEWVIAVGNPYGLGGSVSAGIISGQGRNINSDHLDDFIQTDAAINKGNSGGPLFNINGEVIGVATAIFSPSGGNIGIGFATPAKSAIPVIEQLKKQGEVVRGWLGVSIQDVSSEVAAALGLDKAQGALVNRVFDDSPAQKSGILQGDIILKFDDKEISTMKILPQMVMQTPLDKEVEVVLLRKGKNKIVKVQIKKLEEKSFDEKQIKNKNKKDTSDYILDMGIIELNDKIRKENEIEPDVKGLLIADVKSDSAAAKKGVEEGDVILLVNQMSVKSISELKKIIKEANKSKKSDLFFFIKRGKNNIAVALPLMDK